MQDRVVSSQCGLSKNDSAAVKSHLPKTHPGYPARSTIQSLGRGLLIACSAVVVTCIGMSLSNVTSAANDPNNILLDFSATWCGPCQQMSPIVSKLERQGYPIRKVDIDVEDALARKYRIESIPCFVLIANGREVTRLTGPRDEKELKQLMAMLPKPGDDVATANPSRNGGGALPVTNSKSSDDKKSLLRIPPIFAKTEPRNSDVSLQPTEPKTVRGQSPTLESTADTLARELLMASTRIRIKDGSRIHYGSGSIIDSQPGRAVVLTCAHVFRDLSKDAVIEVDVFQGSNPKPQTVVGRVLKYDMKSDIGLLAIPTQQQLPIVKLAMARNPVTAKDRVMSIGCGGGERPTREDHLVTAVNKYDGPDNVECNGVPQQGRSGGGLFLGSELVGICIAADPKEKRGIYTGLKPVAQLLALANLGHLAPPTEEGEAPEPPESPVLGPASGSAIAMNDDSVRQNDEDLMNLINSASKNLPTASSDYVGAEIVCIVRPKTPGAMSRVVIVNQASSRLVDDLLHESGNRTGSATTVKASKKRSASESAKGTSFAMQKPNVSRSWDDDNDQPIETSFEPAQPGGARRNMGSK